MRANKNYAQTFFQTSSFFERMIIQCIQYIEFEQKGENQLTGLEKMGKLTFLTFFGRSDGRF